MVSSIIGLILVGIISVGLVSVLLFMWYVAIYTKDKVLLSVAILLTVILGLIGIGSVLNYFGL